ncbi:DUF1488 family protein [Cupriavidus necator]
MAYPQGLEVTYIDDDIGVLFDYLIGGHNQTFVVSREALEDHFGLDLADLSVSECDAALLESFGQGWERIRTVAARNRAVQSSGRIVLKSSDF